MLAFVAILVGGACGGLIGYAVVDLQCTGDCTPPSGLGVSAGAVVGALGVAVVAVLALRAMGEWRTIDTPEPPDCSQAEDDPAEASRRSDDARAPAAARGPRRLDAGDERRRDQSASPSPQSALTMAAQRADLGVEQSSRDVDPRVGLERAGEQQRAPPGGPAPASGK